MSKGACGRLELVMSKGARGRFDELVISKGRLGIVISKGARGRLGLLILRARARGEQAA